MRPTRYSRLPPFTNSAPLPVAYPPWYDPSFWYEGLTPHLVLSRQLDAFWVNALRALFLLILVPGLVPLLMISGWRREVSLADLRTTVFLTVPAALGICLYCLVYVEGRYIAPFLVVLSLTLAAQFYPPDDRSAWLRTSVLTAVLLTCGYSVCRPRLSGYSPS